MTLDEIKIRFAISHIAEYPWLIEEYSNDSRKSVQAFLNTCRKKVKAAADEEARLEKMLSFEKKYNDYEYICGIDEAGRGPYAGPVVAGAVVLPKGLKIPYLNDSKQLSEAKREELYDIIMDKAISAAVGIVGPERIDEINILQADYEAIKQAISKLSVKPDVYLNDALTIPGIEGIQEDIKHGDAKSLSIAAASVIAKVTRDRMMLMYDELYPEYGFAKHKGYGTAEHEQAIRKFGLCPIHRKSFTHKFLGESNE